MDWKEWCVTMNTMENKSKVGTYGITEIAAKSFNFVKRGCSLIRCLSWYLYCDITIKFAKRTVLTILQLWFWNLQELNMTLNVRTPTQIFLPDYIIAFLKENESIFSCKTAIKVYWPILFCIIPCWAEHRIS